jgi:magnesium chelatase subunit D
MLVFLTDGSANVARDGEGGRTRAMEDALSAASAVARAGLDALLIDISARPKAAASDIAAAMKARCVPLPMAESGAIDRAVRAARSNPRIP